MDTQVTKMNANTNPVAASEQKLPSSGPALTAGMTPISWPPAHALPNPQLHRSRQTHLHQSAEPIYMRRSTENIAILKASIYSVAVNL